MWAKRNECEVGQIQFQFFQLIYTLAYSGGAEGARAPTWVQGKNSQISLFSG